MTFSKVSSDAIDIAVMSGVKGKSPHDWARLLHRAQRGSKWFEHKIEGAKGGQARPCWLHWMSRSTKFDCPWGAAGCQFGHEVDSEFGKAERKAVIAKVNAQHTPKG